MDKNKKTWIGVIIATLIVVICGSIAGGWLYKSGKDTEFTDGDIDTLVDEIDDTLQGSDGQIPEEYTSATCENMNIDTFIPDGWFKSEEEANHVLACYITKTELDNSGLFDIGFTISKLSFEDESELPSEFVESFFDAAEQEYGGIREVVNLTVADLQGYTMTMRDEGYRYSTVAQYILIASDIENIVYMIWFETPGEDWEEYKEIGDVLLDDAKLNVDYLYK